MVKSELIQGYIQGKLRLINSKPLKNLLITTSKVLFRILCLAAFLFGINIYSTAQEIVPEITIKKTTDFKVNGKGNSPQWEQTEWFGIFPQKGPKQAIAGTNHPTRVKVLYSETGIYCLYDCQDETLTSSIKKDFGRLFTEDVVEFFLWPNTDYPIYLEYELSPRNKELLILVPNIGGAGMGWRPWLYEKDRKVQHETSVTGGKRKNKAKITNWKAEFFIPYAVMSPIVKKAPPSGTHWRANFYRIDYDQEPTYYTWAKTSGSFHEYEKFGIIAFE